MKRYQTRIPNSMSKIRLDHFLADWLPQALGKPISKTSIRTLVLSGSVYVNRHREKNAVTSLYSGAVIEVYYDEDRMSPHRMARIDEIRLKPENMLFEDEWLIIADKPSGLPTQPTLDPSRANLFDLMKKFFLERDQNASAYVGLHHRLDKDTSGIVLFTKKESANKGISDLFLKHDIQKTYQCICWRSPSAPVMEVGHEFTIENYLGRVGERSGKAKFGSVKSGGDLAITHFKVLERFRDLYWLQAMPQTGRTHQIRVHCSEAGFPILGDAQYFPDKVLSMIQSPRLMLHAAKLEFVHPMTERKIEVSSQLPEEFMRFLSQTKT